MFHCNICFKNPLPPPMVLLRLGTELSKDDRVTYSKFCIPTHAKLQYTAALEVVGDDSTSVSGSVRTGGALKCLHEYSELATC